MKANPGGHINPEAAVGRESLVKILWETIEQQSIVITAERRIGKTTVIKIMKNSPPPGWVPVFQDLEACHTAAEFAQLVYREVHLFLGTKGKIARRTGELLKALGGVEIGGMLKLPEGKGTAWKEVLTRSVEDLVHENDATGTKLLFLWDEVPFMLANIRDREGEHAAMEVLDLLRQLRQTHKGLRMVITGSIGLHHVLTTLKDKKYANAPTNDMASIEVFPLDKTDAALLAEQLIAGEGLTSSDAKAAAEVIADEADCFAFYIHHIVKALKIKGLKADETEARTIVASHLIDSNDPWELQHYRERIRTYYGDQAGAVCLVLDELAVNESATVAHLLGALKGASAFDDRERLFDLLTLMERDHYLRRETGGAYQFRFPLIRRWWKLNRGL